MNPNRKPSRGPKKPLRVPTPKPAVEYSQHGRRVLTVDEAAALAGPAGSLAGPAEKSAKTAKRSTFDEASEHSGASSK
jgi:hypothetical protein